MKHIRRFCRRIAVKMIWNEEDPDQALMMQEKHQKRGKMEESKFHIKVKTTLLTIASWAETIISIILVATIIMLITGLIYFIVKQGPAAMIEGEDIRGMLQRFFEVVICVEFVRMLIRHSVVSVVEIILFSIAREMIAEVQSPVETIVLIGALFGLMVIRKYFLLPEDKVKTKTTLDDD